MEPLLLIATSTSSSPSPPTPTVWEKVRLVPELTDEELTASCVIASVPSQFSNCGITKARCDSMEPV